MDWQLARLTRLGLVADAKRALLQGRTNDLAMHFAALHRVTGATRYQIASWLTRVAPPTPRSAGAVTLVQLERAPHRCPWCGSTDTRLDNIFGPTPCRSLRYCNACRQPFEQFKTI